MNYKLYRPSNGSEGMDFEEAYCLKCDYGQNCPIHDLTMIFNEDEDDYPNQWRYVDKRPTCIAFVKSGKA